ncbi:hypothetical protein [Streptomyces sp. NPDC050856]|uniref:hypothetical protein n=1 Tax=Streptomyces sp. NPDC050856 TaxID=3154939 RepID=UPI0033C9D283
MRAAATTEPGRLRILGAVLAAPVVTFGAVTAVEVTDRAAAADDVVGRSQPLSADAADIYRSPADADTAAAGGFLAGVRERAEVRRWYEKDIATVSRLLVRAAANTEGSAESVRGITVLTENLPRCTGLVERARAAGRQGLPLGGAHLRYADADQRMATRLLPAAERLHAAGTARLGGNDRAARAWPWPSLALGAVAVAALLWAQRRSRLRTNRVFDVGLLAATAAATVALAWLAAGHAVARADPHEAGARGQDSLKVLNEARIGSLEARADETLTLVARGAVLTDDGKHDKYETEYAAGMDTLGAALGEAGRLADDPAGRAPVADAVGAWARAYDTWLRADLPGISGPPVPKYRTD